MDVRTIGVVGVRRAVGSCENEYGKRRDAVYAAYAVVSKAIEALNQMAAQIRDLHAEANALADRFALPAPSLHNPRSPDAEVDAPVLPAFWRFRPTVVATEFDEHRMRERRTYTECSGSEAFRIIEAAGGPKPFPPLTAEQEQEVANRVVEQRSEREAMAEFAREAATLEPSGADRLGAIAAAAARVAKPLTLAEKIGE